MSPLQKRRDLIYHEQPTTVNKVSTFFSQMIKTLLLWAAAPDFTAFYVRQRLYTPTQ